MIGLHQWIRLPLGAALLASGLALAGCEEEGTAEKAGAELDKAAEQVKDAADQAAEKVKEATE